eukprot:m.69341 g.69341  ORF g.69341 m.69341 type:complete len:134 (+) comp12046_c0_seq2:65-466(+)
MKFSYVFREISISESLCEVKLEDTGSLGVRVDDNESWFNVPADRQDSVLPNLGGLVKSLRKFLYGSDLDVWFATFLSSELDTSAKSDELEDSDIDKDPSDNVDNVEVEMLPSPSVFFNKFKALTNPSTLLLLL